MRRIKILSAALFILLFLILPASVLAYNTAVLGEATTSATPSIAPTEEGPGFILPDSPFFFVDNIKQNVRLFFAFTPEAKAKVHSDIAGERLAELRLMLIKNNKDAVSLGLNGIEDNLKLASEELSKAQLTGRNVKDVARIINNSIKRKQNSLDSLEEQAGTEDIKERLGVVQDSIFRSKLKVEDSLPEDELENEILDDLERKAGRQVREASDSAREIRDTIEELNKQSLESVDKASKKRQEAINKAIEQKNEQLKKVEEKLLANEKKKQETFLNIQKKASKQAIEAVEQAQKAAQGFQQAQQAINEIRKRDEGVSVNTSSGSNFNSGSGSSGSGGSSSNSVSGGGGDSGKSGSDDGGKSEDD